VTRAAAALAWVSVACGLLAVRAEAGPAAPVETRPAPREVVCPVEKGQVTVNGVVLPAPPGIKSVTLTTLATYHVNVDKVKPAAAEKRVKATMKHFAAKKVAGMKLGPFVREQRGFTVSWTARGLSKPDEAPMRSWFVSLYVRGKLEGDTVRFQEDPVVIGLSVGYHESTEMTDLELEQARPRCGR
jgi:hypothetical protein